MKKIIILMILSLTAAKGEEPEEQINLKPISGSYSVEGVVFQNVKFQSGKNWVEYTPPWPIFGYDNEARMTVPGKSAQASLQIKETQEPLDLQDDPAIIEFIKGFLPKEAEDMQIEKIERDNPTINKRKTTEVIYNYAIFGNRNKVSWLIAQRDDPKMNYVFSIISSPPDFEETHRAFRKSLYSIVGF